MEDSAKPRDLEDRTFRFAESGADVRKAVPRTVSNSEDESDARTHRTPKALRARPRAAFALFGI